MKTEEEKREQFEKAWWKTRQALQNGLVPKVPNDWDWEKRVAYWVWRSVVDQLESPEPTHRCIP